MKLIQKISTFIISLLILINTVYFKDENRFAPFQKEESKIAQHSDFGDFCKHLNLDDFHKCDYNCSTAKIKGTTTKYCENILNLENNYYILASDLILILQAYQTSDLRAPPLS